MSRSSNSKPEADSLCTTMHNLSLGLVEGESIRNGKYNGNKKGNGNKNCSGKRNRHHNHGRKRSGKGVSKPLTTFPPFPELPPEIRFQIWRIASCEPRIIELMWDKLGTRDVPASGLAHYYYRIPCNSSQVPAILQVSHEARREALTVYKLQNFTGNISVTPKTKRVYYNPYVDIIYFGEGSCLLTMYNFLSFMSHQKEEIHRVAILCSGQVLGSCDWGHEETDSLGDVFHIGGRHTPMQLLHGIDPDWIDNAHVPGCAGLEEVLWILPTPLKYLRRGEVDEDICFRPAVGDGMTKGQKKWKNRLESDILRVRTGEGVPFVGKNRWIGNDMPNFKFMSLSRAPEAGKVYDALAISAGDFKFLRSKDWKFIRNTEKRTKCFLKVCEVELPTQPNTEIGFYGTRKGVDDAKGQIKAYLESCYLSCV